MADDSGIDPRYAAQFQRGYDPARHEAAPPPPREPNAPARLPGGPATTAQRVPDRPVPRVLAPTPEAAPPAEAPAAATPVEEPEVEPEIRRPPHMEWALPALGAVLLLTAVWLYQAAISDRSMYTGNAADDYAAMIMRNTLPGPLLVAAVLAFTAWLVVRALRRAG